MHENPTGRPESDDQHDRHESDDRDSSDVDDTQPAAPLDRSLSETKPRIDGYVLLEPLGRGASAVVYRTEHNGEPSAIKVLRSQFLESVGVERFEREARTLSSLDHPGLVRVLEWGESNGNYYMVQELLSGRPIDAELESIAIEGTAETQHGTRLRWILQRFEEVAGALAFLHARGFTHRDVKPDNILIDGEGRARLVDLGLAHAEHEHSLTMEGELLGTVAFISPEQAMAGRVEVDTTTDIYSLGASLYYCLTGQRPFKSTSSKDTLRQVLLHDPPPLRKLRPDLPRDLERVVSTCMEKDSGHRYATADMLADDLRRVRNLQAVSVKGPSRLRAAARFARRHRTTALALFAILIAALITAWAIQNERHQARYANWTPVQILRLESESDLEIERATFPPSDRVFTWDDDPVDVPVNVGELLAPPGNRIHIVVRKGDEHRRFVGVFGPPTNHPFVCGWGEAFDPNAHVRLAADEPIWVRIEPLTVAEIQSVYERLTPKQRKTLFPDEQRVRFGLGLGAAIELLPADERPDPTSIALRITPAVAQAVAALEGYRLPEAHEWRRLLEIVSRGEGSTEHLTHLEAILTDEVHEATISPYLGTSSSGAWVHPLNSIQSSALPSMNRALVAYKVGERSIEETLVNAKYHAPLQFTDSSSATVTVFLVRDERP